jgi:hypothetical protein
MKHFLLIYILIFLKKIFYFFRINYLVLPLSDIIPVPVLVFDQNLLEPKGV